MEKYAIKQEKKQGRNYKHIKADEREKIAIGLGRGDSLSKIAKIIGRSPSTISREVKRNRNTVFLAGEMAVC